MASIQIARNSDKIVRNYGELLNEGRSHLAMKKSRVNCIIKSLNSKVSKRNGLFFKTPEESYKNIQQGCSTNKKINKNHSGNPLSAVKDFLLQM